MNKVFDYLDNLGIKYDVVNHPAAFTTEEADKYIEGMEGVPSKTMFMAGKKDKNFYLFIMDEKKRLDIKKLSLLIKDINICIASKANIGIIPLAIGIPTSAIGTAAKSAIIIEIASSNGWSCPISRFPINLITIKTTIYKIIDLINVVSIKFLLFSLKKRAVNSLYSSF